jgi:hypothetical protein
MIIKSWLYSIAIAIYVITNIDPFTDQSNISLNTSIITYVPDPMIKQACLIMFAGSNLSYASHTIRIMANGPMHNETSIAEFVCVRYIMSLFLPFTHVRTFMGVISIEWHSDTLAVAISIKNNQ